MFMLGRVGLVRIADSIPRSRNDLDPPLLSPSISFSH